MSQRCAFLTMDNTDGWSIDADLAVEPMAGLGWSVDTVPWRAAGIDWRRYAAVYVGTPWDYPEDPQRFLAVLRTIDAATLLVNPLPLLTWNIAKTYLRDLEERGAAIVPTEWLAGLDGDGIALLAKRCRHEKLIVKPVVSTNATDTFLLDTVPDGKTRNALAATFKQRECMVQPFVDAIQRDGEYSLFYIGGKLSHAIRKRPGRGDFRVQEEHGASIDATVPDARLASTADSVMALVEPQPLYARVDFVRAEDGSDLLMELELIEPSLYLRMDTDAPLRFARAFDDYVRSESRLQPD